MGIISLSGVGIIIVGFCGVLICLARALQIRRAADEDASKRAALARLVPLNVGAMGLSAIGIMVFVIGVLLD